MPIIQGMTEGHLAQTITATEAGEARTADPDERQLLAQILEQLTQINQQFGLALAAGARRE